MFERERMGAEKLHRESEADDLSWPFFWVLPAIKNRMNYNFMRFHSIKNQEGKSSNYTPSKIRIASFVNFWKIDDFVERYFDTIKEFKTKPSSLFFIPCKGRIHISY